MQDLGGSIAAASCQRLDVYSAAAMYRFPRLLSISITSREIERSRDKEREKIEKDR